MQSQIYVKTNNDDITSIVVANANGTIYFQDTIDVPELTGIQRGVSFVKHHLDSEQTEIFPDKLSADDVLKDVYINWCKVNVVKGSEPNSETEKRCLNNLQTYLRWNMIKGNQNER